MARFVYAIADPRTDQVMYVGCSATPIERYRAHISSTRNGRKDRSPFADMIGEGVYPKLLILSGGNKGHALKEELKWILFYRSQGHPLVNRLPQAGKFEFDIVDASPTPIDVKPEEEPQS